VLACCGPKSPEGTDDSGTGDLEAGCDANDARVGREVRPDRNPITSQGPPPPKRRPSPTCGLSEGVPCGTGGGWSSIVCVEKSHGTSDKREILRRPPHAANNLLEWSRATCAARDRVRRERQSADASFPASAGSVCFMSHSMAVRGSPPPPCTETRRERVRPQQVTTDQPGPKPTKNRTPTTTNATNRTTSPMGTMRTSCGFAANIAKGAGRSRTGSVGLSSSVAPCRVVIAHVFLWLSPSRSACCPRVHHPCTSTLAPTTCDGSNAYHNRLRVTVHAAAPNARLSGLSSRFRVSSLRWLLRACGCVPAQVSTPIRPRTADRFVRRDSNTNPAYHPSARPTRHRDGTRERRGKRCSHPWRAKPRTLPRGSSPCVG